MLKLFVSGACLSAAVTVAITVAPTIAMTPAWAQSPGLSGQQITELVAGSTVEIDTPTGSKLPVRYAADGRLAGEARGLAWYLGSPTDLGRWWVAGDQLCHKWIRWFNGEPQCLRLSKEGRIVHWQSQDGNTGTASIAIPAPAPASTQASTQASALLAMPRAFAKRMPETAPVEAPPPLAGPPRLQAPAEAAAVALPPASPRPKEPIAVASASVIAPAPVPPAPVIAVRPPPQAAPKRPIAIAEARPMFMVTNVRHDDVLNVRSGPSADFGIVGELPPGSRGIAITSECRAGWCPVAHHATSGWVNRIYLAPQEQPSAAPLTVALNSGAAYPSAGPPLRDSPEAPRSCLKPAARALLDRIEQRFGPVRVVSTCRSGAMIAGTSRVSRHASGNAIDFDAGSRKPAILEWLIANHRAGGVMTYAGMDHIHVDIGPHFVSLGSRHGSRWRSTRHVATPTAAASQ